MSYVVLGFAWDGMKHSCRRGIDRGRDETGADEAANDAPDKSAERDNPPFHLVTSLRSSDEPSSSCSCEFPGPGWFMPAEPGLKGR
jgi:hypothetical protein